MNRLGVVLAADSATTVEYWNGSASEVRYFKGANKIFQLSDHHPVGIMIYNSVDVLRVPWEVVLKEFRKELGPRSFNDLTGYADELLSFINEDARLFPESARQAEFEDVLDRAIFKLIIEFQESRKEDNTLTLRTFVEHSKSATPIVQEDTRYDLSKLPALHGTFSEKISELLELWLSRWRAHDDVPEGILDLFELTEGDIEYLIFLGLRAVPAFSPSTGLILAGFGEKSVYPEVLHLSNSQFILDKFCESNRNADGTSFDVPAAICGFAQTSMIDTLRMGFSGDVLNAVSVALQQEVEKALTAAQTSLGQNLAEGETSELAAKAVNSVINNMFDYAMEHHSVPLRRVVGVLPIDELCELAETLINLQSLKEKVTKPSETVGGPVDVAAITRAEGLVWVKRKHYFDAGINSRYFERRARP